MAATGLLSPLQQFFTDDGDPASGWLLYTYSSGSSTPVDTFLASDLDPGSANTNPIELDAAGRAVIYLDPALGAIKLVMHDADDALQWTQDNISVAAVAT